VVSGNLEPDFPCIIVRLFSSHYCVELYEKLLSLLWFRGWGWRSRTYPRMDDIEGIAAGHPSDHEVFASKVFVVTEYRVVKIHRAHGSILADFVVGKMSRLRESRHIVSIRPEINRLETPALDIQNHCMSDAERELDSSTKFSHRGSRC